MTSCQTRVSQANLQSKTLSFAAEQMSLFCSDLISSFVTTSHHVLDFYPTALKDCWSILFTDGVRMGWWVGGGKKFFQGVKCGNSVLNSKAVGLVNLESYKP